MTTAPTRRSCLIPSTDALVKDGIAYSGVPLLLVDGRLEPAPSLWLLSLATVRRPKNTIDTYAECIDLWFNALTTNAVCWHQATKRHVDQFVAALVRSGCLASTVRLRVVAVCRFYRWAESEGLIAFAPFTYAAVNLPSKQRRAVRPHSLAEFNEILAYHDRKTAGLLRRDELICEAGRFMGLRRSEVAGLRIDQFLHLDPTEDVHCIWLDPGTVKGGRGRYVLAPRLFVLRLQRYIQQGRARIVEQTARYVAGYEVPPHVFLNDRGKNRGQPVSPDYITDLWRTAARKAGLDSRFHNNRSSFATIAADTAMRLNELPLPIVKELLGHRQETTSEIYIKYQELRNSVFRQARVVNDFYEREHGGGE